MFRLLFLSNKTTFEYQNTYNSSKSIRLSYSYKSYFSDRETSCTQFFFLFRSNRGTHSLILFCFICISLNFLSIKLWRSNLLPLLVMRILSSFSYFDNFLHAHLSILHNKILVDVEIYHDSRPKKTSLNFQYFFVSIY